MIRFEDVSVDYATVQGGRIRALNHIHLTLADSEYVAVMGPNGSGKSTLARLCNGLVLPSAGTVHIDEFRITADFTRHIPDIRRRVGMVFQNPDNQIVSTTVEREIAFGLENLGVPYAEMHARVAEALRAFDLLHLRNRAPHQLSGGEKQRLALAAVMVMQPRHLILDEPTALLDFRHQSEFLQYIRRLRETASDRPPTVVHITHFAPEALFATRLIVLHRGEVYMDGPPEEIFLQESRLREIGMYPPIEFSAFLRLREKLPIKSVEDLRLRPIL